MIINFEATITNINSYTIIKIPLSSSEKLLSRGMVMIQGTLNEIPFIAPLEPDGKGSHWLELSDNLVDKVGAKVGQTVTLSIEPVAKWPEPEIPADIMDAIVRSDLINEWNTITTKAHWEWLRWIRSTNNPATREKRINVACSKMQKGEKRPCCFDATRCTVQEVSKTGVLID
ncbi:MAG: uncharacterized protein K0R00_2084 [Herbinix sp.]|jgi:hypothetical protein|nr:uncharacterized protein [Herbinix sp.]